MTHSFSGAILWRTWSLMQPTADIVHRIVAKPLYEHDSRNRNNLKLRENLRCCDWTRQMAQRELDHLSRHTRLGHLSLSHHPPATLFSYLPPSSPSETPQTHLSHLPPSFFTAHRPSCTCLLLQQVFSPNHQIVIPCAGDRACSRWCGERRRS